MFRNLSAEAIGIKTTQRETVRLAEIGNFEGTDLSIEEACTFSEKYSPSYVKGMFDSFNMKMGGWNIATPSQKEEKIFQANIEKLKKYSEVAGKLGAKRVFTWIMPFSDEMDYKENFSFHTRRLKTITQILTENGCRLGLEFIGTLSARKNHKYEFVHTQKQVMELCKAVGNNTGILLDSWHWYASGGTVSDLKQLNKKEIVYVHISDAPAGIELINLIDNKRYLPGETEAIDLQNFLKTLKNTGYDGPVTPEPFSERVNKMPDELAVRLTGGYFLYQWNKAFKEK
jgi:sugar phosphate isomerase/epimerase